MMQLSPQARANAEINFPAAFYSESPVIVNYYPGDWEFLLEHPPEEFAASYNYRESRRAIAEYTPAQLVAREGKKAREQAAVERREKAILALAATVGPLSVPAYAQLLRAENSTVRLYCRALAKKKLLIKIGNGPSTKYRLTTETERNRNVNT